MLWLWGLNWLYVFYLYVYYVKYILNLDCFMSLFEYYEYMFKQLLFIVKDMIF